MSVGWSFPRLFLEELETEVSKGKETEGRRRSRLGVGRQAWAC